MSVTHPSFSSLPAPSWLEWCLWLLRRRHRIRVRGNSMIPTLYAGQMVLVSYGAYLKKRPRVGDIVLARHPQQNILIIKRVATFTEGNNVILHSDNAAEGTDSRHWGALPLSAVVAKVCCRLEPNT